MSRLPLLVALALVLSSPSARGDEVVDAQGRAHSGIITKFSERVIHLRTGFGLLSFKWEEVDRTAFKHGEYLWPATSGKPEPARSVDFLKWWKLSQKKASAEESHPVSKPQAGASEGPQEASKPPAEKSQPTPKLVKKPRLLPARTLFGKWVAAQRYSRDSARSLKDRRGAYRYFNTPKTCEALLRVSGIHSDEGSATVSCERAAYDLKNRLIDDARLGRTSFAARLDGSGPVGSTPPIPLADAETLRRGDVLRVRLTAEGVFDTSGRVVRVRWTPEYIRVHQRSK